MMSIVYPGLYLTLNPIVIVAYGAVVDRRAIHSLRGAIVTIGIHDAIEYYQNTDTICMAHYQTH